MRMKHAITFNVKPAADDTIVPASASDSCFPARILARSFKTIFIGYFNF